MLIVEVCSCMHAHVCTCVCVYIFPHNLDFLPLHCIDCCYNHFTYVFNGMMSCNINISASFMVHQPNSRLGSLIVEIYRSYINTHTPQDFSEQMISLLQRSLPTPHTANARDKHPSSQWDSNPQSQQSSSCTPIHVDCTATQIGTILTYILMLQQTYWS